jgi:hypothetical protein
MTEPEFCLLTNEYSPVVCRAAVREAYEFLAAGHSSEALAKLRDLIGPDVPELEPLTIV